MAYTEIINKAYDLADELKESKTYQEMKRLDNLIKDKYKIELKQYQDAFLKFDEVFNTGGTYHPDFKEVSNIYRKRKEVLFNKEEVKQYFKYEKEMNKLLNEISNEITNSLSNYKEFKGGICHAIK